MKQEVKIGDMITYKNGKKKTINVNDYAILRDYYDEDLNCLSNDEYTIVAIQRPYYETIYSRNVYTRN